MAVPRQSSVTPPSTLQEPRALLTCWVLRVGSMPSDWHTRLSSPVSAPESIHASQPQTTIFCAAHRKHLGQPGQSLQFKPEVRRDRESGYRKPGPQGVLEPGFCESPDFQTDPPLAHLPDLGLRQARQSSRAQAMDWEMSNNLFGSRQSRGELKLS